MSLAASLESTPAPREWLVAHYSPSTILGEGPIWSVRDQCLYYCDINGKKLHRYTPASAEEMQAADKAQTAAVNSAADAAALPQLGRLDTIDFGSMIGCLALTDRPQQLLLAAASGLWLFDWSSLRACPLAPFPGPAEGFRFNDGGVSPAATLLVGTMCLDEDAGKGRGAVYEYAVDASTGEVRSRQVHTGVSISNGIDWTQDEKFAFYIDTPTRQIERFEWQPSSVADTTSSPLTQKRVAFVFPDEHKWPDGMTMDAEGNLWIASFGGSRVTVWGQGGQLHRRIDLPASQGTCPVFGGPDLRDLYVTSAMRDIDLSKEPLAGSLFVIRNAGQGRPGREFKLGAVKLDDAKAVQHQLVK